VGHYTGEVRDLLVRSGLRPSLWLASLLLIFMLLMVAGSILGTFVGGLLLGLMPTSILLPLLAEKTGSVN